MHALKWFLHLLAEYFGRKLCRGTQTYIYGCAKLEYIFLCCSAQFFLNTPICEPPYPPQPEPGTPLNMQLISLLITLPALAVVSDVSAWSPSNGYAPANVTCPTDFNLIREANELSANETEWVSKRKQITKETLNGFLTKAMKNFNDTSLLEKLFSGDSSSESLVPKIGIAASGGGYRAMLSGAGMLAAMDNRTTGADEHGLGGLLQSATYLAGLSGGNWLTGTLAWNNWTSVQDIIDNMYKNNSIWDITNGLISSDSATLAMWAQVFTDVTEKKNASFNITLADYWGRALAYNFFPSLPDGGAGYTWSSIRDSDVFMNAMMPFPISVTDVRHPFAGITPLNSTIVEFNPFEMGSWDPSLNAFADVKYIGSKVNNGKPVQEGQCIAGFDNTGFVIGTSSTLFTPSMVSAVKTMLGNSSSSAVGSLLIEFIANDNNDVASYSPNPFKGSSFGNNADLISSPEMYLADGGEDSIEIPLISLIQKKRDLDVIFALDNSADTAESWPNGTSLVAAYQRQFSEQGKNISFPYVPSTETFVSSGLNKRPTFFGCDARNLTDLAYIPPLIVYLPNSDFSFASNTSTLQLQYSEEERLALIQNGFEAATRGNFTGDSDFLGCIACAVIRRKQQSSDAELPAECDACFTNYCWDGSEADSISINSTPQSTTLSSSVVSSSSTKSTSSKTSTKSSTSSHNAGSNVIAASSFTMTFMFILNLLLGVI